MTYRYDWRCKFCGRFIAQKDFDKRKATQHFIPGTPFNIEELYWYHNDCKNER